MQKTGGLESESRIPKGEVKKEYSFAEDIDKLIAKYGALGAEIAKIFEALETANTLFFKFDRKKQVDNIMTSILTMKVLEEYCEKQEGIEEKKSAYNFYIIALLLEDQLNRIGLAFLNNMEIFIHTNLAVKQLRQLQNKYLRIAGSYRPRR